VRKGDGGGWGKRGNKKRKRGWGGRQERYRERRMGEKGGGKSVGKQDRENRRMGRRGVKVRARRGGVREG